jgi:hypothetical protein
MLSEHAAGNSMDSNALQQPALSPVGRLHDGPAICHHHYCWAMGIRGSRSWPFSQRASKKRWKVEAGRKATGSMRKVRIGLAAVIAVLALAPAAFAQSTGTGYGGQGGGVAGQVAPGGPPSAGGAAAGAEAAHGGGAAAAEAGEAEAGGLLAFTGLDVALIVGGGLLLLAAGVALSRIVARNPA